MSLFITSLNSGSNGNCYYIGNRSEAVLVDAGISCREIEKRMARQQLSMSIVKALFISHEHTDHISGVAVLAKKYQLPVYITPATLKSSRILLNDTLVNHFTAYAPITIGQLTITGFPKSHDASDPHSFVIENNGVRVGVFTDIGVSCPHVIKHFSQCHAAFLEANYDEQLLQEGLYPHHLKKRIRSDTGHLSNTQALALFTNHKPSYMSHLLLSHLSKDNNSPTLVENLFNQHADHTHIIIASRHHETEVYCIQHASENSLSKKRADIFKSTQTTLFS